MYMRAILLLLFLTASAYAQVAPDDLEITRRFATSGMLKMALARIEQLQPPTPAAPRWAEWEQLRCSLLDQLAQRRELVQRAGALPAAAPDGAARHCLMLGARAAIATGEAASARDFLARLVWRYPLSSDEMRQARLLVIDSYLAQNDAQDAYALMLRYHQDFQPLDRATAARFVSALLGAGMEKEAVNWYTQLDDASPSRVLLQLVTGLVKADAAIAHARAALAKAPASPDWWSVVQRAAAMQSDRVAQTEALENLLQLADGGSPARMAALAHELWKSYLAAALDVANQNQLLFGDDVNWTDYAARRLGTNPVAGRAMYAYLAQQARAAQMRQTAQLQLAHALQTARLSLTAVRLFDEARFPRALIDAQTRYLLGAMALERNQARAAAHYWSGLAPPPQLPTEEWLIRLAQTLVRAGEIDAGAETLRTFAAAKSVRADMMRRALAIVQEIQDSSSYRIADDLYRALRPLAEIRERREILFALGRGAESSKEFKRAAEHYLEAALLGDTPADALAVNARIAAAANLARAGLKDDARIQFDWLQKNVRDAEKLDLVRREMQKL
jgi:hypothetical protein